MMAESASATTNASPTTANPGAGEPIPQWKKELLQRRKNLAKTIGTAATQVHDSASTVAAALTTTPTTPRAGGTSGSPFGSGGHKDPSVVAAPSTVADTTSCPTITTSVPSSEPTTSPTPSSSSSSYNSNNNNNNDDSPASPIAATTPTSSLFGAPVFVGHSPVNEHPATSPPQVLVKSALVGGSTTNTNVSSAATRAVEVPLHGTPQQSHSNDGPESTSCTSSTSRSSLSHLHSSNNSIGASSGGPVGKYAATSGGNGISASSASVDCELTRPTSSGETSNSYSSIGEIGWKSKKNTSSASSSSSPKMVAASAEEIIYEKNPRFVGPGGEGTTVDVDSSEELKYGPGIVSKLRCRYLSLALRQSANKQRPSLNNMRRATSLNNLLDEESEDLSEREQSIESKDHHHQSSQDKGYLQQQSQNGKFGQITNQMNTATPKAKTPDEYISTFQKSVQNSYTRSGRQTEKKNEYNRYNKQRGADSLKRARSVEALVRYDHKAWERDIQKENLYSSNDSNVIILDEISCTNGTNGNANNCQTVAMNKAELITDCVTIEEKIINGREKGDPKPKRLTSFIDADERPPPDVVRQTMKIFEANANRRGRPVARTNGAAGEVAAKVACYKSIISQDKPPITHPKPPLSPKKPNIIPRSTSPKSNGTPAPVAVPAVTNGLKEKPTLPKLDIGVIRNNLETTNNLKNSASTPVQTPTAANHNNNNTSTPLSVRVPESQSYRLKYESPALSPNNTAVAQHKVTSSTTTTNRPESPRAAAAAACMQNNTPNSTALTFIDSPSIPTLASKLNNLNIATSTPTSTRSSTPQDLPPQVPPRHPPVLQYATSDEEDPDDPEDQQNEYSINHSDRDQDSDQSDDLEPTAEGDSYNDSDEFDSQEVKKVSRAAMDNISRAGVTTQFRFNGQSQQNKSHLPSLVGGGAKLLSNKKLNVDDHHHQQSGSNSSSTSSSPITVPAAIPATIVAHKPPVPLSRESLASANGLKPNNNSNSNNSNIGSVTHSLNSVHSSNANTNSSVNNSNGSKVVINDSAASAPPNMSVSTGSDVSTKTVNLTAREIEKNQINLVKSEESLNSGAAATAAAPNNSSASVGVLVGKTAGAGDVSASSGGDFFMAKWGAQKSENVAAAATAGVGSPLAGLVPTKKKVKAPPPPIEANTMVFNFSDRKDVPDYIENDGIILRPRPRELPKPGESGFVVLGDLTLETSTDPDDSWAMGPPSPCDVEFANANIVINGKSSMRNKTSRDSKFKIQFDDSLTSTFEYPSEISLLEVTNNGGYDDDVADGLKDAAAILTNSKINNLASTGSTPAVTTAPTTGSGAGGGGGGGGLAFGDNGLLSHKNTLLSSMPLGSAPFASYTPVKAAIDTTFELGVTRTPSPSSTASSTCSSNEHHPQHQQQSQSQQHQNHHHPHLNNHHQHSNGHHNQQHQGRLLNGDSSTGGLLLLNGDAGEPESIQYLKPASDEQTVNWSQGTRVTDLLF